jgi:hypothetical protein
MKRRTVWIVAVTAAAIAVGAVAVRRLRGPVLPPPPTKASIEALRAERDALGARVRELVIQSGERSLGRAPHRRDHDRDPDVVHSDRSSSRW